MNELKDLLGALRAGREPTERWLDVQVWAALGYSDGDDDDQAWLRKEPMAPTALVNGLDMHEALRRFPGDARGIAQSWSVPRLTESYDAVTRVIRHHAPGAWWECRSVFNGNSAKFTLHSPYSRVGGPEWTGMGPNEAVAALDALIQRQLTVEHERRNPPPSRPERTRFWRQP